MALSPNYNWSEPDNSSLVKDGAQAMRTLGDAIDTSVWNVGMGQAGKSKVINGNYDIWQRGTTFTTIGSGVYNADRWQAGAVYGTNSLTRQTTGVPVGSTYCLRFQGTMAGTLLPIQQIVESINVKPLLGKSVTFSIKLRRNAAFDQNIIIYISKSATTDATYGSTWSVISQATITNASLPTGTGSTDWVTASVTATIPTDGTANSLKVVIDHSATVANNGYYEVAQAMLEAGNRVTPFQTASGGSIQGELAMCQRYYYRVTSDNGVAVTSGIGSVVGSSLADCYVPFPVTMRRSPTSFEGSNLTFYATRPALSYTGGTFALMGVNPNLAGVRYTHTAATLVAGDVGYFFASSTPGYLGFSAEL